MADTTVVVLKSIGTAVQYGTPSGSGLYTPQYLDRNSLTANAGGSFTEAQPDELQLTYQPVGSGLPRARAIKRIVSGFILFTSVLAVAAGIMWCRSYMVGDVWRIANTTQIFGIESANGVISLDFISYLDGSHFHISSRLRFHESIESRKITIGPLAPASWLERRGFYASSSDTNPRVSWVQAPYWFLTMLLVTPLIYRIGADILWNNFNNFRRV